MNEVILVALIPAVASVLCQVLIVWNSNRKKKQDDETRDALLEDRLKRVEQKLDEHNSYAKRMGEIEKAVVRIDTKLEALKERI